MKKILSIAVAGVLMLIGSCLHAQTSIGFGSAARIHSYDFKDPTGIFENADDSDVLLGGAIQFEQGIPLGEIISFSVGANLGLYARNDYLDIKNVDIVESYLDFPIRIKFGIPLGENVKLNLFAGPVPSIGLGSKIKVDNGEDINLYKDLDLKRFDLLIGGGAGLDIIEHIRLAVSMDASTINRWDSGDGWSLKTPAVTFTAAYIF